MSIKPKISVVVCTHNGEKYLDECLNALSNQTLNRKFYEVIIVDDASNDSSKKIAQIYDFQVHTNPINYGLARSRNVGVDHSSAEIIAFTDDDCVPSNNWLSHILKHFSGANIVGVSGPVLTHKTQNIVQRYIDATKPLSPLSMDLSVSGNFFYRLRLYLKRQLEDPNFHLKDGEVIFSAVGANMALRRSLIEDLNGFDPSLKFGGEEEDFCYRFHKKFNKGARYLSFFNDIVVEHNFDESFIKNARRNYMYGIGNFKLFKKHESRNITLLPFPILILTVAALSTFFNANVVFVFAITMFLFYVHWVLKSLKQRTIETLLFPFFQFIFELCFDLGVFTQYLKTKFR